VECLPWDGVEVEARVLAGARAVVHLSGEPIFGGFPTASRRRRIWESRVTSTASLVDAIGELPAAERPACLLCASAVGIYGDQGETALPESGPQGTGFLADLCRAWEEAAERATGLGVRVVSPRLGLVLAGEGGALPAMARLFRSGLGGRLGSGRQWVPWVHVDDVVGLLLYALQVETLRGPLNAVSPRCVRNAELTKILAARLRRPAFLPAPGFVFRTLLGGLAGELLDSRHVVPDAARRAGYVFRTPLLSEAVATELG